MNIRSRRRASPSLDMTPLIDVVFLLLIFFMVSTTFDKQTRLKVDLPEASAEVSEQEEVKKITVTIDAQGHFYVNDYELVQHDRKSLIRALEKAAGERRDVPVVVTGDRNAPYQSGITIMDAASQLGLTKISFVAQQSPGEE